MQTNINQRCVVSVDVILPEHVSRYDFRFLQLLRNIYAGGGPFYVPAVNIGLGFSLKLTPGLSHSVVAVGAVGSVLYGLLQPAPDAPGTSLLNLDIALTLIPAMLFGVSFGAPTQAQCNLHEIYSYHIWPIEAQMVPDLGGLKQCCQLGDPSHNKHNKHELPKEFQSHVFTTWFISPQLDGKLDVP